MKLIFNSPINKLSYGYVGSYLLDTLIKMGHDVQLFPINEHNIECEPQHLESVQKALNNSVNYKYDLPYVKIYHQFALAEHIGRGFYAGFPIFELNSFSDLEKRHLDTCDLVITCSKWGQNIVKEHASPMVDTAVVPLGVDRSIFYQKRKENHNKTVFLTVGKWEYRKGHNILGEAFAQAFQKNENVELWLACDSAFCSPEQIRMWKSIYEKLPIADKVRFVPRMNTQREMAYLMNNATFGVYPTRAEGWCMPALEGMACGLPPIISNYSGQTEYLNANNHFSLEFNTFEDANDGLWFKPGGLNNQGQWGCIDEEYMEQLVYALRDAHRMNIECSTELEGMRQECIRTSEKFSWENSATQLLKAVLT